MDCADHCICGDGHPDRDGNRILHRILTSKGACSTCRLPFISCKYKQKIHSTQVCGPQFCVPIIFTTRVHFYFKFINRLRRDLCETDTYGQKIGTNQSFALRKVLSFDKICFCVPTQKVNVKKKARKVCRVEKNDVPLPTLS